jgi:hypothetical protein
MLPGVNFINMFTHSFFTRKTKKLLIFENELHHAFSYENCAVCAIRKSHLVVLAVHVAICKSQISCAQFIALIKPHVKMLMKLTPDSRKGQLKLS